MNLINTHFIKFIFTALLLFNQTKAVAKDLVVTDIDDTIKISHVTDTVDSTKNAFTTSRPFWGMANLLGQLLKTNTDTKLVYLSNAPRSIFESSRREFLRRNLFPAGDLLLRNSYSDSNFKLNQIRKLILAEKPSKILLIGDNGESDSSVYQQVQNEYPNIEITILIHLIGSPSSKAILYPQIGFATAIDAGLSLASAKQLSTFKQPWLDLNQLDFLKEEIESFLAEPDQVDDTEGAYIPNWMNCTDYQQQFNTPYNYYVELYKAKLPGRCAHIDSELIR